MTSTLESRIPALSELLETDLDHLLSQLNDDLPRVAGKRLLITGGAGFLGYYLVQTALAWNRRHDANSQIDVTVWDNYIRGVPGWLLALQDQPHLTLQKYDLRDPLPEGMGHYDYIIHAAGIASPQYYRLRPLETMDANINGLRSLLEYARSEADRGTPVDGLLFYSSSEIYGDPPAENVPTPEEFRGFVSCTGPRACYDESKRYGETLCVVFAKHYGVPVAMARPFNNYGPGLKISDRRVIPDYCRCAMQGEPIVMYSDGSPTRTFCYSADAVAGYYKVLLRGRPGEPYNIGTETPEISMYDLACKIAGLGGELFGREVPVIRQPSPEQDYLVDNPQRRCPQIGKARRELNYQPGISLDEGLRRTLSWYHYHPQAEDA
ncbi:MAG: NAD-dependent epimerase/dehydratase family protein [Pirellulales bacterium]